MCGPTTQSEANSSTKSEGNNNKQGAAASGGCQYGSIEIEKGSGRDSRHIDNHPTMEMESTFEEGTNNEDEQQQGERTNKGNNDNTDGDSTPSTKPTCRKRMADFYWENEFLILVIVVILLAKAYPPLGAVYLAPQITATWIAVIFIFLMAGLGLKTEEFSKAFQQVYFNTFVQIYNFGVDSSVVYGISRLLTWGNVINQDLADGMVIAASLPLTINMVLVLTKASGGDEAAAIFNAAFGNLVGVFLSPILILGYLGVTGSVNVVDIFYKLALRVLLPLVVGQILQKTSKFVMDFVQKYKKHFKQAQQYTLVFIVYTTFCSTFSNESESSVGDIFIMIAFIFISLTLLMVMAWYLLKFLFPTKPALRVMGLYGCTHKTVAIGIPLINAMYENNPAVGLYTLPLLIWHPMQLVIGTMLSPRLAAFVKREQERLGISEGENEEFDGVQPSSPITPLPTASAERQSTANGTQPRTATDAGENDRTYVIDC